MEKTDKNTPETYTHRVIFMWMMNEIPISSKGPKRCDVHISAKRWKEMLLTSESTSPGNIMHIGQSSEKTWNIEKYPDNPKWD